MAPQSRLCRTRARAATRSATDEKLPRLAEVQLLVADALRRRWRAAHVDLDDVAAQEPIQGPVNRDADLAIPGRQPQQVVAAPGDPGDQPGHLYAQNLTDSAISPERHEHPELRVGERLDLFTVDLRKDVPCCVRPLANGVLR